MQGDGEESGRLVGLRAWGRGGGDKQEPGVCCGVRRDVQCGDTAGEHGPWGRMFPRRGQEEKYEVECGADGGRVP